MPDISALDWIQDWDTNKTHLGAELVVTPKLFAGEKHDDGLVTGIALGHFPLAMYDDTQGEMAVRQIDGIAGFDHGRKVFSVESTGDVELGFGGQSIRYNAATGQIEFRAGVSMHWIGATYIDPDGIFTGTLSAETVSAVRFNASQITAGTIDAARIDTDTLKTVLLTAGNVEALTLNVRQGTIGGWTIDDTGIYRGTKRTWRTRCATTKRHDPWRERYPGAHVAAGCGRGRCARRGEYPLGRGGGTCFSPLRYRWPGRAASMRPANWPKASARRLSQHPLTYIGATGIYTGSLTAQQITAGFLLAERFEAGSIKAEKLDADSIKASIVNAAYINGLDCTFGKGTIGGWRIGTTTLSAGHLLLDSANRRMAVYGEGSGPQDGRRCSCTIRTRMISGFWQRTAPAADCTVRRGEPHCRMEYRHGAYLQGQRGSGRRRVGTKRGEMAVEQRRLGPDRRWEYRMGHRRGSHLLPDGKPELAERYPGRQDERLRIRLPGRYRRLRR